jgi:hypothetical protein
MSRAEWLDNIDCNDDDDVKGRVQEYWQNLATNKKIEFLKGYRRGAESQINSLMALMGEYDEYLEALSD